MRMTGIARAAEFSPGVHVANDRAILDATAAALRVKGCQVEIAQETEAAAAAAEADLVFTMAQSEAAIAALVAARDAGVPVINDPDATRGCCRVLLLDAAGGDPLLPPTLIVDTAAPPPFPGIADSATVWVKRSGAHAMVAEDVVRADDGAAYAKALDDMRRRGIGRAVVQRHVAGPVAKFYAVAGTGFFRWRDDATAATACARAELRAAIEALAARIGLDVYGGDVVLAADGARLIDLNDWPSFAPCRDEAAAAIADLIVRRSLEHGARRAERRRA